MSCRVMRREGRGKYTKPGVRCQDNDRASGCGPRRIFGASGSAVPHVDSPISTPGEAVRPSKFVAKYIRVKLQRQDRRKNGSTGSKGSRGSRGVRGEARLAQKPARVSHLFGVSSVCFQQVRPRIRWDGVPPFGESRPAFAQVRLRRGRPAFARVRLRGGKPAFAGIRFRRGGLVIRDSWKGRLEERSIYCRVDCARNVCFQGVMRISIRQRCRVETQGSVGSRGADRCAILPGGQGGPYGRRHGHRAPLPKLVLGESRNPR